MRKKLYSIIVPVYNCEQYLEKCLNSLLKQSYKNIEIILINDGSNDNSEKICLNYKKLDSRIKYYKKDNGGVSSARNLGINVCNGDYITFLDSDDYLDIDTIEFINNYINKSDIDLIRYGFIKEYGFYSKKSKFVSETNKIIFKDSFKSDICPNIVITNDLANCTTSFIKKQIIEEIRFDTTLKYGEDRKFIIEIFSNCNSILFLNECKYHYVYNVDSATNVVDNFKLLKQLKDVINSNIGSVNLIKEKFNYIDDTLKISITNDICNYLSSVCKFKNYKSYEIILNDLFSDKDFIEILNENNYNYHKFFLHSKYRKLKKEYYLKRIKMIIKKVGKRVMKYEKRIFKSL